MPVFTPTSILEQLVTSLTYQYQETKRTSFGNNEVASSSSDEDEKSSSSSSSAEEEEEPDFYSELSSEINVTNLETIWRIIIEFAHRQEKKLLLLLASSSSSSSRFFHFQLPNPAGVRISSLSLGECIEVCISLLKLCSKYSHLCQNNKIFVESESETDDDENFFYNNSNRNNSARTTSASAMNSTTSFIPKEGEEEKEEEYNKLQLFSKNNDFYSKLETVTSWICEIMAETIRGRLRVSRRGNNSSFCNNNNDNNNKEKNKNNVEIFQKEEKELLQQQLLYLLADGNLLERRENVLDVLQDHEEELKAESETLTTRRKQHLLMMKGRREEESDESDDDDDIDDDEYYSFLNEIDIDWRLEAIYFAKTFSKNQIWKDGGITFQIHSENNENDDENGDDASPMFGGVGSPILASPTKRNRKNEENKNENNNNDANANEDEDEDDDSSSMDWKDGLIILAPFIVSQEQEERTSKTTTKQKHHHHHQNKYSHTTNILLFTQCPLATELRHLDLLIQHNAIQTFRTYWLKGLRQHFIQSSVAGIFSCIVAAASNPVVERQQLLERHLEKSLVRAAASELKHSHSQHSHHHHNSTANSNNNDRNSNSNNRISNNHQNEKEKQEENLNLIIKDKELHQTLQHRRNLNWTFEGFSLLASLIGSKMIFSTLIEIVNTLLRKVAAGHREDQKKKLTFAWTRVPLSTMNTLPSSRVREVTNFPNDLEGISVFLQNDLVWFARSILHLIVALSAVAAKSNDSSSSSNNNNNNYSINNNSATTANDSNNNNNNNIFFISSFFTNYLTSMKSSFISNSTAIKTSVGSLISGIKNVLVDSPKKEKITLTNIINNTKNFCSSILQSPRARVTLFVIGVTASISLTQHFYKKIKTSDYIRKILRPIPDEEEVASGSEEYEILRRRGKILMAPNEIIQNIRTLLRVQGHADEKAMKMWYDSRKRKIEQQQKQQSKDKKPSSSSFDNFALFSNYINSLCSNSAVWSVIQNSVKSFFVTLADVSDWVTPLTAAAFYQRFLMVSSHHHHHQAISRFLILECLNSAQSVMIAWKALQTTWNDRVKRQAYKTLIVETIISSFDDSEKNEFQGIDDDENNNVEAEVDSKLSSSSSSDVVFSSFGNKFQNASSNAKDECTKIIAQEILNRKNNGNNSKLCIVVARSGGGEDSNQEKFSKQIITTTENNRTEISNNNNNNYKFLFAYPSRPHRTVLSLDQQTFQLPLTFGSIVGIVGKSGCGKTSLLRILLREVDAIDQRDLLHNLGDGDFLSSSCENSCNNNKETKQQQHRNLKQEEGKLELALQLQVPQEQQQEEFSSHNNNNTITTTNYTSSLSNFSSRFIHSKLFSFVPQSCQLLPGSSSFSVAENISLMPCSQRHPNQKLLARIRHAAHLAGCDDIISDLPEGIWTCVAHGSGSSSGKKNGGGDDDDDEDGGGDTHNSSAGGNIASGSKTGNSGGTASSGSVMELSGGQIQRIGIARAIFQGAAVLLMDEPTASLSKGIKVSILETLKRLVRDSTSSSSFRNNNNDNKEIEEGCEVYQATSKNDEESSSSSSSDDDDDDQNENSSSAALLATRKKKKFQSSKNSAFVSCSDFPRPRCVVYVTHDDDAIQFADQILELNKA